MVNLNVNRLRVIKLGGSLLLMPGLKEKFQKWLQQNLHPLSLIVVGGGEIVDAVRNIHAVNALPEDFAHWVCVDLMRHTARLAQRILGDVDLYETLDDLQRALTGAANDGVEPIVAIVQPGICFARQFSNMGLPETWEVTSDALATAISRRYAA